MHYSLSTEKVYLYWVRFFIRWHERGGQMKHPRSMGGPEIEGFFNDAGHRAQGIHFNAQPGLERLAVSVQRSSEYGIAMDGRHQPPNGQARIPSVLTKDELAGLLAQMEGVTALLARVAVRSARWMRWVA